MIREQTHLMSMTCNTNLNTVHYFFYNFNYPPDFIVVFFCLHRSLKFLTVVFPFQGQAIISFLHVAKNMNVAELDRYADVILDACCRNISANDETWHSTIEMSVLLVTCTQRRNPRSSWYVSTVGFLFLGIFLILTNDHAQGTAVTFQVKMLA